MEEAIDYALAELKQREEKKIKKQFKKGEVISTKESCKHLEDALVTGKRSPILLTPKCRRKNERRTAVSEKNTIERDLVKEAVKKMVQSEHISKYKIL